MNMSFARRYFPREITAPDNSSNHVSELWIAFKMYLSNGNHSITPRFYFVIGVVNYFQNVSFQWKSQLITACRSLSLRCELLSKCIFPMEITARKTPPWLPDGCELLSKCIFPMEITAAWSSAILSCLLWIAFKMYLSNGNHSLICISFSHLSVVNCFQNVSFQWKSQRHLQWHETYRSCELLSKCIFPMEITALVLIFYCHYQLWIAFKMYLSNGNHSHLIRQLLILRVVNCFQNVSFQWKSQRKPKQTPFSIRCELLSKCIFPMEITASLSIIVRTSSLWIAFKMYLSNGNHSFPKHHSPHVVVVNCFQNVSFQWKSQRERCILRVWIRCELLSKCIFPMEITAITSVWILFTALWIAFKMYLSNGNHSIT